MEMEIYWGRNTTQSERPTGDVPCAVRGRPGKGHAFPESYNLALCFRLAGWKEERHIWMIWMKSYIFKYEWNTEMGPSCERLSLVGGGPRSRTRINCHLSKTIRGLQRERGVSLIIPYLNEGDMALYVSHTRCLKGEVTGFNRGTSCLPVAP